MIRIMQRRILGHRHLQPVSAGKGSEVIVESMILLDYDDYMLRLTGSDGGQVYDARLPTTATLGLARLDRVIVSPEKEPER